MSRNWSKEFNELPREVRIVANAVENRMRINQLLMEKARLKKYYLQSVAEINTHIKNLEEWLWKLEREP